jgi:hypothetical protein
MIWRKSDKWENNITGERLHVYGIKISVRENTKDLEGNLTKYKTFKRFLLVLF